MRTDDGRKVITIAHPEQSSGELKTKHIYPNSSLILRYLNSSPFDQVHFTTCEYCLNNAGRVTKIAELDQLSHSAVTGLGLLSSVQACLSNISGDLIHL